MKLRYLIVVAAMLLAAGAVSAPAEECTNDCCCPTACCSDDCSWGADCCHGFGLVGGIDLTLFSLYARQGAGGDSTVGNVDDYFPDYGLQAQGRYWLGYELPNGYGLRVRIFQWQADELYNGIVREQDFEVYDLEGTLDMSCVNWRFTGFAGMRWASIELDGSDFGGLDPYNFGGTGLTTGIDFRRPLLGNFSLVGGARYSVLYGDTDFQPATNRVLDNTFLDIKEVKLGIEWALQTRWNARLFATAAWEHQIYGTDTYLLHTIDPETIGDVSLAGPVFSIGLDR